MQGPVPVLDHGTDHGGGGDEEGGGSGGEHVGTAACAGCGSGVALRWGFAWRGRRGVRVGVGKRGHARHVRAGTGRIGVSGGSRHRSVRSTAWALFLSGVSLLS